MLTPRSTFGSSSADSACPGFSVKLGGPKYSTLNPVCCTRRIGLAALSLKGGGKGGKAAPTSCIFLFTGEGAHSKGTDLASLKKSPSWDEVQNAVKQHVGHELEGFLRNHLGEHSAPSSPIVSTIINILNGDRWRASGHKPMLVLGHSIGEVAAAYTAGLLTIDEAIRTASVLGHVGGACKGAMVHVRMMREDIDSWLDDELRVAALNGVSAGEELSVTLCGPSERVDAMVAAHPDAKRLTPPHPWHHPMYLDIAGVADCSAFADLPEGSLQPPEDAPTWLSATRPTVVLARVDASYWRLDAGYWKQWVSAPVDFHGALIRAAALIDGDCYTIEMVRTGLTILAPGFFPLPKGLSVPPAIPKPDLLDSFPRRARIPR